ncbi:MAG: O-antigen ligase family protein [Steroidobacteraceae bacterium]
MTTTLAFVIFSVGVAGLFYLDRDDSSQPSAALWVPVTWLWITGSRPISEWLGLAGPADSLDATLQGNPVDAAIFAALVAAGLTVLIHRGRRTAAYLAVSGLVVVYFLYALVSVTWSPFTIPALKRWTKAIGDLVMVLVILTDGQPIAALRRLYSRVGFVLFPFSVMMIRYTNIGRGYDPGGTPANVGVTTNKNSLGLIVFVISLGLFWNVRCLLIDKNAPHRGRRLLAQCTSLAFGIALLQLANSATSVICFALGAGLMLATSLEAIRKSPRRVLAISLGIVLAGAVGLFVGGGSAVSESLGRGSGLTGRLDIWSASLASAGNPFFGTGFESFWNANSTKVNQSLSLLGFRDLGTLNSAHNGYLQIFLDLGVVGLFLVGMILISGYRNASKAFRHNPDFGSLMLACIVTATFYSVTEVGFRILTPSWIFLLLGVIGSKGVVCGLVADRAHEASTTNAAGRVPVRNQIPMQRRNNGTPPRPEAGLRRRVTGSERSKP